MFCPFCGGVGGGGVVTGSQARVNLRLGLHGEEVVSTQGLARGGHGAELAQRTLWWGPRQSRCPIALLPF